MRAVAFRHLRARDLSVRVDAREPLALGDDVSLEREIRPESLVGRDHGAQSEGSHDSMELVHLVDAGGNFVDAQGVHGWQGGRVEEGDVLVAEPQRAVHNLVYHEVHHHGGVHERLAEAEVARAVQARHLRRVAYGVPQDPGREHRIVLDLAQQARDRAVELRVERVDPPPERILDGLEHVRATKSVRQPVHVLNLLPGPVQGFVPRYLKPALPREVEVQARRVEHRERRDPAPSRAAEYASEELPAHLRDDAP